MRIGICQINSIVGDLEGNTVKIIDYIEKGQKKKVDFLIFPELCLTGYPPEDLLFKPYFIKMNRRKLNEIVKKSVGVSVIVGFVDSKGDRIYNAAALIEDGQIKDVYRKIMLPNYGVFDEKRYFSPGDTIPFYYWRDHKFSLSICEDIWEPEYVNYLKGKEIDFLINISASPFHSGKLSLRKKILVNAAKIINTGIIYCNLVGGQDELVFDGTSMVISPSGDVIIYGRRFNEDIIVFDYDNLSRYKPLNITNDYIGEIYNALSLGLSDYVYKNGFKKVIVGVSGGIDSATVISLAVFSLGKRNVIGLIMPSRYTSLETLKDAHQLCKNLGVKYYVVNIEDIYGAYLNTLKDSFRGCDPDITEENIQARIRGNLLMAFSNKFGYLVLNTGNKSELSCGYCTLYGDMVGGFGVLKDVPKTVVYRLARYINKKKKIIPESIFSRPPSAELRPDQKDTDTLPPYNILDKILKLYIEEHMSFGEIIKRGFNSQTVRRVIEMVDRSEYKRRQAPPGIKITPCAFGKDRRMPITNRFSYR